MNSKLLDAGEKFAWGIVGIAALAAVAFVAHGVVYAVDGGSIETQLVGKSATERANIKAAEIAGRTSAGEYNNSTYGLRVEIQNVAKIEGGVEFFARAWKGAQQLGFGKDGSVEIERFRIFNPPILVPDENGDVVREWAHAITGEVRETKFREDPAEAARQSLAHTIALVGKEGTGIVKGKRGNTTSTFYPAAGAASPVDGYVAIDNTAGGSVAWPTIRDATDGNLTGVSVTSGGIIIRSQDTTTNWSDIFRGSTGFNTSAIGTDAIESATVSWYSSAAYDTNTALGGWTKEMALVSSAPASDSNFVNGDYDSFGTTQLASNLSIATWNTSGYNNFALNASGEVYIDGAGVTHFGLRQENDRANSAPTTNSSDSILGVDVQFADTSGSGTTQDPTLVVEHYASAPTGVRKSMTQTASADTTTDDDSELAASLAANSEYDVHGVIFASSTSQVPDIKVAFTVPTGAMMDIVVVPSSAEQAELLQASNVDTDGIPIPANQPIVIQVMGTVKTGAASGVLKFQWAQNQSDAAAVGVLRGSYLRVGQI